ncbi:hypothetical protein HDU81_000718 [Chytriomyces hyalinus]|nr:hypothetical protein HDU81_000718 [Chytriomyces hyalinus]
MATELFRSEAELQEIAIVSLLLLSSTTQPRDKSMYANNSASLSAQLPWHMAAGSQLLFQTPNTSLPGSRVGSEEPLLVVQGGVTLPPLSSLVGVSTGGQLIVPSSPPTDGHSRRFSLMGLAPIPAVAAMQGGQNVAVVESLTDMETVSSPASVSYTTVTASRQSSREGIRATKEQLKVLLAVFEENATPTGLEHSQIGERIGMSRKAVRNWFQNYRAKVRRNSTRGGNGGGDVRSGSLSEDGSPPSLVAGGGGVGSV